MADTETTEQAEPADAAGGADQQDAPQQEAPQQEAPQQDAPQQRFLEQEEEGPAEEIEHPTKLLRIAHSVRSMLDEVKVTDLDEAGRKRLADIHNRTVSSLREILSEDLSDELSEDMQFLHDEIPTGSELRIAQAQLAGWLEGLFRGIQASMATQQMAAKQQLQQMRQQRALGQGEGEQGEGGTGQYL